MLSLFDKLIRPILTYGCDVWGDESNMKSPIEDIHLSFCRFVLGIPKSSPKLGIYGELGRYPLDTFIKKQSLRYYNHTVDSSNVLLRESLLHNINTKSKWFCTIESLVKLSTQNFTFDARCKLAIRDIIRPTIFSIENQRKGVEMWPNFIIQ